MYGTHIVFSSDFWAKKPIWLILIDVCIWNVFFSMEIFMQTVEIIQPNGLLVCIHLVNIRFDLQKIPFFGNLLNKCWVGKSFWPTQTFVDGIHWISVESNSGMLSNIKFDRIDMKLNNLYSRWIQILWIFDIVVKSRVLESQRLKRMPLELYTSFFFLWLNEWATNG